ncbi:MAG: hypothetical protein HYV18_01460 [Gammaproteobacteria bacterium]|nr:hypothetical protein [Gammaproteobacteria bacterium]
MRERRSHYDVTNTVNISDPAEVCAAICGLLSALYPGVDLRPVRQAHETFGRLYAGILPGYHGCDTWYHDAQHSLDCALAMARLLDGYERSVTPAQRVGARRAVLGVICALFHDAGYIRRLDETAYHNGAEFTLYHVTRSGEFLQDYLPAIGFAPEAALAARLVHFTGYEMALDRIEVQHAKDRWIGYLLGTADIVAQMADRCYPEKCHKFLFHEFRACGLAGHGIPGGPKPIYSSPEDLIRKTPEFAKKLFDERLDGYFEGCYRYLEKHFGGPNPYLSEIRGHLGYVLQIIESGSLAGLRRRPRIVNARVLRGILNVRLAEARPRRRPAAPHPHAPLAARAANPGQFVPT